VPVSKRVARERLEIRQDGRYIVSVGVHAIPRKGTELLVESFAAARLGANDRLLLAGPLGDRLSGRLRTDFSDLCRAGRIVVLDRYINDIEVMNVLAAADLVCTPYIGHLGSSAIVLQAMKAERPVLAPHQGWFAAMVPHFQLGTTGDILEATKLASALVQALERSESYRLSPAAMRLTAYSDADNFGRMWARRLRERMGLPTDPALRTWDWVLGGAQFPEG
jgi:glycosyltransferase involved in cell wall biosynthesis